MQAFLEFSMLFGADTNFNVLQVLVQARAEVDKCSSSVSAILVAGNKTDTNSIVCELNSSAADDEVVRNACVAISTNVAAHVCGDGMANATFEVEAKV